MPTTGTQTMAATKQLHNLPNDILLRVPNHLEKADLICLSLTSHQFYDLVLAAEGKKKLKEIRKFDSRLLPFQQLDKMTTKMMERLLEWVPSDHRLCAKCRGKFIRGINEASQGKILCLHCWESLWDWGTEPPSVPSARVWREFKIRREEEWRSRGDVGLF